MGSRYKNRGARQRLAEAARKGGHFNAIAASRKKPAQEEPAIGDLVRVKTTGAEARVESKASWGDYELQEMPGYYPADRLEILERAEA